MGRPHPPTPPTTNRTGARLTRRQQYRDSLLHRIRYRLGRSRILWYMAVPTPGRTSPSSAHVASSWPAARQRPSTAFVEPPTGHRFSTSGPPQVLVVRIPQLVRPVTPRESLGPGLVLSILRRVSAYSAKTSEGVVRSFYVVPARRGDLCEGAQGGCTLEPGNRHPEGCELSD